MTNELCPNCKKELDVRVTGGKISMGNLVDWTKLAKDTNDYQKVLKVCPSCPFSERSSTKPEQSSVIRMLPAPVEELFNF